MGRIKPRPLKAITENIFREKEESFTTDFSANKPIVTSSLDVRSKKLRNVIAGYATRLKRRALKK
jgi:small subunit ribosomal protein S17e